MTLQEIYMHRCIELAKQAAGYVAPNPMVGAVLVHGEKIIGEGFHRQFGQAHAEVNCIHSVQKEDEHLIKVSTLYVSLEPCAHYGKTPPCADLIIKNRIPRVVIGCRDPFLAVNGKGIEKLLAAGVEVHQDVLRNECISLNKRFFTYHTRQRPYIILKWAQSGNGRIGSMDGQRIFISNEFTNRLVHKWRSEESSILVGTNTALFDNPQLNVRKWSGPDPVRLLIDMNLRLPQSLNLFQANSKTIIFNTVRHGEEGNLLYYQITRDVNAVHQMIHALYQLNIQSVLVEGGARLLQSFIDEGMWDEARIIKNEALSIAKGIPAPVLSNEAFFHHEAIFSDDIYFYKNINS